MTEQQQAQALAELEKARGTWNDLPRYVYSDEYETALIAWVDTAVKNGREDINTLILYALDHETGGKRPYFDFDRSFKPWTAKEKANAKASRRAAVALENVQAARSSTADAAAARQAAAL